jgi:PBP1b-binding outer membrane lipoprotein LpoB
MKKTLTRLSILAVLISGCKKNDLAPEDQTSINSGDAEDLKSTATALIAYRMPASDHFDSIPQDPKNPLQQIK